MPLRSAPVLTRTAASLAAITVVAFVAAPASAMIFVQIPGIEDASIQTGQRSGLVASRFELVPASIDEDGRHQPARVSLVFDDKDGSEPVYLVLAQAAAQGRSFDEVVIAIRKDTGDEPIDFLNDQVTQLVVALERCQVVGWATSEGADGGLLHELTLVVEWADSTLQDIVVTKE